MLTYLQKYNSLPGELRDKISTPAMMAAVDEMERKYGVNLATLIMRVMVKDIAISDLVEYFNFEAELDRESAEALAAELTGKIFIQAADYLGIGAEPQQPPQPPRAASGKAEAERWLQSRRERAASRPPDFYFSAEDEEEIKDLSEKVRGFSPAEMPEPEYDPKVAKKIIGDMNLRFFSEDLDNRFSGILESCWRGVRKPVDAKEALEKSRDKGGLDLKEELADEVLARLNKIKQESVKEMTINPPVKFTLPEDAEADKGGEKEATAPGMRDLGYDFSQLASRSRQSGQDNGAAPAKKELALPKIESKAALPSGHLTIDLKDSKHKDATAQGGEEAGRGGIKVKEIPAPAEEEKREKKEKKEPPAAENNALHMADTRRMAGLYNKPAPAGKVKIEDVKYVPKLMGPIDELREMNLIDFRRLNEDPRAAAAKIEEKIGFLEEENYGKRLAGIKAWRQSPVNKLYLEIGQQSIIQQKPVSAIIAGLMDSDKECLTGREFEAVMELNKSLRF